MEETTTPVQTYQVDAMCPKCQVGFMRPNGTTLMSNPPLFPHVCNNKECKYTENVRGKRYPYFEYSPVKLS